MSAEIPQRWSIDLGNKIRFPKFNSNKLRRIKTIGLQYDHFGIGGAESVVACIANLLNELSYRVIVYTNDEPTDQDQVLSKGVVRKVLPSAEGGEANRFNFWRLEVEKENLDCVIYSSWVSGWAQFDCWSLKTLGSAFILHSHNIFFSWFDDPIADYLSRALPWIAENSDAIVSVNSATAEFFKAYNEKSIVVPNPIAGIHTIQYVESDSRKTGKNIVWVGRISDEKRPYEAVKIFSLVTKAIPDARLTVIGGNSDKGANEPESLARYAYEQLMVPKDSISFTGFLENPTSYYENSDVYLLTSSYEGFPLTLAEAMGSGLPVVSYDLNYLELLQNNKGCLIAPVGDVEQMAQHLITILGDGPLRKKMGKNSLARFGEVCLIDFQGLWKSIIDAVDSGDIGNLMGRVPKEAPNRNLQDLVMVSVKERCLKERYSSQLKDRRIAELEKQVRKGEEDTRNLRLEIGQCSDRILSLEAVEKDLKSQLHAVYDSNSYRIGNALMRPIHAVVKRKE